MRTPLHSLLLRLSLLLPLAVGAQTESVYRLPHSVSVQAGLSLRVEEVQNQWRVRWPDGHTQSLGEALSAEERQRSPVLLQADFNYDGHADLAMAEGVGYSGAYATYRLFLWNPKTGSFDDFPVIVGEPQLLPSRQALIDWQRDGPRMSSTEYRANQGVLRRYVERQPILPQSERALDLLIFYPPDAPKVTDMRIIDAQTPADTAPESVPPAQAPITAAKVWLHDAPQARSRTRMYLIRGDTVRLMAYRPPRDDGDGSGGWLFVRFEGRRPLERWIPASAILP